MRKIKVPLWLGAAAGFALLTGCAADSPPFIDKLAHGEVSGDAERVSIQAGRLDALPLAVAHCARYGRAAQWSHTEGDRSIYRCVPRS